MDQHEKPGENVRWHTGPKASEGDGQSVENTLTATANYERKLEWRESSHGVVEWTAIQS